MRLRASYLLYLAAVGLCLYLIDSEPYRHQRAMERAIRFVQPEGRAQAACFPAVANTGRALCAVHPEGGARPSIVQCEDSYWSEGACLLVDDNRHEI